MAVTISNHQRAMRVPRRRIERLVTRILRGERRPRMRIEVAVVDDAAIRRANRRFLGHDHATDVLAFPHGEIVVSTPTARAEARRRGIAAEEELLRYVAHGVLHLLGYRDKTTAARKRMWARQERYLRAAN